MNNKKQNKFSNKAFEGIYIAYKNNPPEVGDKTIFYGFD